MGGATMVGGATIMGGATLVGGATIVDGAPMVGGATMMGGATLCATRLIGNMTISGLNMHQQALSMFSQNEGYSAASRPSSLYFMPNIKQHFATPSLLLALGLC